MPSALTLALVLLAMLRAVAAQDPPPPSPTAPSVAPPPSPTAPSTEPPSAEPPPAQPPPTALPPAPAAEPTVARPAMVNNSSITAADVALQTRLLGSSLKRLEPAARQQVARRALAEEILLSQEAQRLDVQLSDREVDEWWERRTGQAPDYAAMAAATGSSTDRQREVARRAALADLYLLHRCGLRGEQAARMPPEPLLVRVVTITPSQLREAFAQNRALLDRPETLECEVWGLQDEAAVQAAEAALAAGGRPDGTPLARTLPLPDIQRLFPPDVAAWLADATPGAYRVLDAHTLVRVAARHPAQPATFAQVQEPLRNMLLEELLQEARQHLVDGLRDHATYWPPDLFEPPPKPSTELTPTTP